MRRLLGVPTRVAACHVPKTPKRCVSAPASPTESYCAACSTNHKCEVSKTIANVLASCTGAAPPTNRLMRQRAYREWAVLHEHKRKRPLPVCADLAIKLQWPNISASFRGFNAILDYRTRYPTARSAPVLCA